MAGVTGLGRAFVRADNPEALYAWYEKHLGVPALMKIPHAPVRLR
jgi:hypothetical protein